MKKIYTAALAVLAFAACTEDAKIKIDSLSIIPQTATVYTDEALPELALNVTPEDALGGVTVDWTSSAPEIISVDQNGVLTFEVTDIEDAEKAVTITAEAAGYQATAVITVKGQIARYNIIDLTSEAGLLMLDRNVGASAADKSGNYYQWGNNTPVALEGETAVNAQYSADWAYDKAVDWTKPENTPCPMGWGLPTPEHMTAIDKGLEAIALYDMDFATKEEYDAACAFLDKMQVAASGQFNKNKVETIYLPDAGYFWTAFVSEDHAQVGTFENNLFPLYSKKRTFDLAIPVRCVKAAPKAE